VLDPSCPARSTRWAGVWATPVCWVVPGLEAATPVVVSEVASASMDAASGGERSASRLPQAPSERRATVPTVRRMDLGMCSFPCKATQTGGSCGCCERRLGD
jgi:hypothetical protein